MTSGWAIRRRNGGVDINDAMADDPSLLGDDYGKWVPVVRASGVTVDRVREPLGHASAKTTEGIYGRDES